MNRDHNKTFTPWPGLHCKRHKNVRYVISPFQQVHRDHFFVQVSWSLSHGGGPADSVTATMMFLRHFPEFDKSEFVFCLLHASGPWHCLHVLTQKMDSESRKIWSKFCLSRAAAWEQRAAALRMRVGKKFLNSFRALYFLLECWLSCQFEDPTIRIARLKFRSGIVPSQEREAAGRALTGLRARRTHRFDLTRIPVFWKRKKNRNSDERMATLLRSWE